MKRNRISFFISISLSIIIAVIIFWFSSQNGTTSGGISRGITRELFPGVLDDKIVLAIEGLLRKAAHYMIYFILGISVYFSYVYYMSAFTAKEPLIRDKVFIPTLICFVYSVTDELHQYFVPDRNGTFLDCVLDTIGALSGVLIVIAVIALMKKRKN